MSHAAAMNVCEEEAISHANMETPRQLSQQHQQQIQPKIFGTQTSTIQGSDAGGLNYDTGAVWTTFDNSGNTSDYEVGKFAIMKNGSARMPIGFGKKVVVSTYRNNVYCHFFADDIGKKKGGHFSMNIDELEVFLGNLDSLKEHVLHHQTVLQKLKAKAEEGGLQTIAEEAGEGTTV